MLCVCVCVCFVPSKKLETIGIKVASKKKITEISRPTPFLRKVAKQRISYTIFLILSIKVSFMP
jgi:hypothetical protein